VYASFQATEKLSLHARGEYFWESASIAPTAVVLSAPTATQIGVLPGKVLALTGTIQYDLWKNVLSRFEVRWDHAANGIPAFGGDIGGAAGADKKNAVLVAANLVYKF
jgi:hypothetical protein